MGGKRKHQVSEQKSNSHPKGKGKSYAKGQSDSEDGEGSLEKKSVVYVIAIVVIGECFYAGSWLELDRDRRSRFG